MVWSETIRRDYVRRDFRCAPNSTDEKRTLAAFGRRRKEGHRMGIMPASYGMRSLYCRKRVPMDAVTKRLSPFSQRCSIVGWAAKICRA